MGRKSAYAASPTALLAFALKGDLCNGENRYVSCLDNETNFRETNSLLPARAAILNRVLVLLTKLPLL